MALELVTAPVGYPVTATEIYDQIKADVDGGSPAEPVDAAYVTACLAAAVDMIDGGHGELGRAILTQTWDLKVDHFPRDRFFRRDAYNQYLPAEIKIPLPPLQSVTSITYVDTAGASQTLATSVYQVVTNGEWPARIVAAYGQTFPETRDQPNAVTVRFVAGFGDADDVPASLKHAIKFLAADLYGHRESVVIGKTVADLSITADRLMSKFRIHTF